MGQIHHWAKYPVFGFGFKKGLQLLQNKLSINFAKLKFFVWLFKPSNCICQLLLFTAPLQPFPATGTGSLPVTRSMIDVNFSGVLICYKSDEDKSDEDHIQYSCQSQFLQQKNHRLTKFWLYTLLGIYFLGKRFLIEHCFILFRLLNQIQNIPELNTRRNRYLPILRSIKSSKI